ncbi:MAG: hypothetical protein ACE5GW_01165 [Planctomycetota bacterium]
MKRFAIDDVKAVENIPASPLALRKRIEQLIVSSTHPKAKIEAVNPETGEYRIVLQGTLIQDEPRFEGGWV